MLKKQILWRDILQTDSNTGSVLQIQGSYQTSMLKRILQCDYIETFNLRNVNASPQKALRMLKYLK